MNNANPAPAPSRAPLDASTLPRCNVSTLQRFNASTLYLLAALLLCCLTTPVLAQSTKHLSVEELQAVRLPDVTLTSVRPVPAQGNGKAFVEVLGVIGGSIGFELLLPEAWNGRFAMGGGGGFSGKVQNAVRYSVAFGYATAGTDTGHQWPSGLQAGWAFDNLEAQLNFGYLAVHRTAEVAKALIRAYYGKDAAHSYFVGASRGGGQAMMESQRYPKDFDGIVAGAPAFNWTGIGAMMVAIAQAMYPNPQDLEHSAVSMEALQKLHAAILEQCDAQDGLKDGIIQDPTAVHFDLAKVPGLTEAQQKAINVIYQGAHNAKGLIYPGFARGAECDAAQWWLWLVGPVPAVLKTDQVPDYSFGFGTDIYKYLIFNNPDWDYSKYDFANFDKDTRLAASFLNATDPDLAGLKARHGKLILWHGWADPGLPPQGTVDYYGQVLAHDPQAKNYCRLFMIPGCFHGGGGPGPSEVDWLSAIVGWVEQAKAPDRLDAVKREHGEVVMSRPLFPYPQSAVYTGQGDPNRAESFTAKLGSAAPH